MKRLSWGGWWAIGCILAIGAIGYAQSNCRENIGLSASCEGFGRFAYDNGDAAIIVLIALGIVGGLALGRLQHQAETRPCPRCGERVEVGELDCPRCDFDFRQRGLSF